LSSEHVTIRPATAEDIDAIDELWSRARSEHANSRADRADALRVIRESPGALLVAELDGRIGGTVVAAYDGWRGNLYRLAVSPALRRRGIARALVRAGEDYLRARGAWRINALVAFDDGDAGAFWDSAGYPRDQVIGRRVKTF
jgi:ribosomal protein S18 acetylase RimI-like enzyme